MTIYILVNKEEGEDSMVVAAYLREELAQQARGKLGARHHFVESVEVMDA